MRDHWLAFLTLYAATFGVFGWAEASPHVVSAIFLAVPMTWLSVSDLETLIIPDAANSAIASAGALYWLTFCPWKLTILLPLALAVLALGWAFGEIYFRRTGVMDSG